MTRIGFVGLGKMGQPMARRLIDNGYDLVLFDRDSDALTPFKDTSSTASASVSDVGILSDIVFLSLPTPTAVTETALEIAACGRVRVVVDLSTTGSAATIQLAERLSAQNVELVDAPVSGGIVGAKSGKLSLLVSGHPEAIARVKRPLDMLGRLFIVGESPGAGQMMKLVNNLLNASAIAITAEGMALGIKAGLDPATMIEVLNASTGRNSATEDKWPRAVLPRTFDFGFATGLCLKDIRLCLEEASAIDVPLPFGALIRDRLERTAAAFGPESDFTSVAKIAESDAGIRIEGGVLEDQVG
jgi:3-hydroxyisobutyrate dehydrogenase-like beta-hydroxyacid dehydrogenase